MNDKEAAKAEFEAAVSKGLDAGLVSCLWLVELPKKITYKQEMCSR